MRSVARAEEAADCKSNDIRIRRERDGTSNTVNYFSGAKEYKTFLNSDFMELEKTFLDSKTKLGVRGAVLGLPGEELTTDLASKTKTGKRSNKDVPGTDRVGKKREGRVSDTCPSLLPQQPFPHQ